MGLSLRNLIYTSNPYRRSCIKVIEKYTYSNILYTCLKLKNKLIGYQKYFDTQQFKIIVNIDRYLLSFFNIFKYIVHQLFVNSPL